MSSSSSALTLLLSFIIVATHGTRMHTHLNDIYDYINNNYNIKAHTRKPSLTRAL